VSNVNEEYIELDTDRFGEILCYKDLEVEKGQSVKVSLRPEKIKITKKVPKEYANQKLNIFEGVVEDTIYLGNQTKYTVRIDNSYIKVFKQHIRYLLDEDIIEWKDKVYIWWFADDSYILKEGVQ
jgi:spermidine/putrescine transport system ATP-binding protein